MEQLGAGRRHPPPSPPHKYVPDPDLEPDPTWKNTFGQSDRLKLAQHMVAKLQASYVGCDPAQIRAKVTRWELQAFSSATSRNHYIKHIAERINEVQEQVQATTPSSTVTPSACPAAPAPATNSSGSLANGNNPNFTAPVGHPNFVPATSAAAPAPVPAPSHALPPTANPTNTRGRGRGRPRGRGRGRVANTAPTGAHVAGNLGGNIVPNGGLMTPEVLLKLQQQQHLRQQQQNALVRQQQVQQQQRQQHNAEVLRQQRLQQQQRAMMNGQAGAVNPYMTTGGVATPAMNSGAVYAQAQSNRAVAAQANKPVTQKLIEFCRRWKTVYEKVQPHMEVFFRAYPKEKEIMARKKWGQIVIFFEAFRTSRVPDNLSIQHLHIGSAFMEMVCSSFRNLRTAQNGTAAAANGVATAAASANPAVAQQQRTMTAAQQRTLLIRQQQLREQAARNQVAQAQAAQVHAAQIQQRVQTQARAHAQAVMQSRIPAAAQARPQAQTRLVQPQQAAQRGVGVNKAAQSVNAPAANGVAVANASGGAVKAQVTAKRESTGQPAGGTKVAQQKRKVTEKELRLLKLNHRASELYKFSVKINNHVENLAKRAEFEKKQKIDRARSTLDMLERLETQLEPRKRKAENGPDASDDEENDVIKANTTFECSTDDGLIYKNKRRKVGQKEGGRKSLYELVTADCEAARMQNDLVDYDVREEYGLPVVDCQLLIRDIRMPRLMLRVQRGYPGTSAVTYGFEMPPLGWVGAVKEARDEFRRAVHRAPADNIGVAALLDMWAMVASAALEHAAA